MPEDPIDRVLGALLQAKPGMGICPAHDDKQQSLSVTTNEKGDVLLHCHAGCDTKAILDAAGLTLQDLFVLQREPPLKSMPVEWYSYRDEHENVMYEVVRYVPKTFRQRRPDGEGGWIWNLTGCERIPYNLPDVLEAIAKERWIFFVEGEKDADMLTRMGFVATTTAGGSGSWSDSMAQWFKGGKVVVVPDNDAPGREYANRVARCLGPVAVEVRVLELPGVPGKGDVSDYMASGGTADELKALVRAATVCAPADGPDASEESSDRLGPLRFVRASDVEPETVTWLWESRIPYGKITIMDGNPGQGKSTLSVTLAADVTRGRDIFPDPLNRARNEPHAVILLSAEDGTEDTVVPRLKMADADLDKVYIVSAVRPPDGGQERPWSLPGDLEHLREMIVSTGARLVVIDPITAFFDAAINANNDHHVRRALHPLKDLASDTGCAMLIVRHLKKSGEGLAMHRGGGSIGIIGAARVGLVVASDPNDETGRTKVVAVSKNNLCETPKSLKFHLQNTPLNVAEVVWDGESPHSAETLLAAIPPDDVEDTARCAEYLKAILATGDLPVPELLKKCRALGISDKTLNRAKKMLGLTQIVNHEGVWWGLDINPTKEGNR